VLADPWRLTLTIDHFNYLPPVFAPLENHARPLLACVLFERLFARFLRLQGFQQFRQAIS
jgi:hypothetical protein